ncbi:MAG: YbaK/EbsC family protein [Actinomycetota bacterium]
MSSAIERFTDAAGALDVPVESRRFPEGTKTADDAARAIGCDLAQIVKSLVFVAGGTPVLALTSGSNRVDAAKLAALCEAGEARRASPEEARTATGFAVGGTPPFGHTRQLRTFFDPELLGFDQVWAAAGTPDSVFPIAPGELKRAARATEADFTETPPAG